MAPDGRPTSANAAGSAPTSSVHWFTFDEIIVPMPAAAAPRSANSTRDDELRRLRRERREPLHEQELLDAELAPVATSPSAKGSAAVKIAAAGEREDARGRRPAAERARGPRSSRAGPSSSGSSWCVRAGGAHVRRRTWRTRIAVSKSESVPLSGMTNE